MTWRTLIPVLTALALASPARAGTNTCTITGGGALADYTKSLTIDDAKLKAAAKKADTGAALEDLLADAQRDASDPNNKSAAVAAHGARQLADALRREAASRHMNVPAPDVAAVQISLANPPTTRLRVTIDGTLPNSHHELVWDPAVISPLVQSVDLPPDTYSVSVVVDPSSIQQGDGSLIIVTTFDGLHDVGGALSTQGRIAALSAPRSGIAANELEMTRWPAPTVSFTCGAPARPAMDALDFPAQLAVTAKAQRSFGGTAPEIVTQTLSLLAEIAVERAKQGAFDLVKSEFVDPLCTGSDPVTLQVLHLSASDEHALAFPRVCQTLTSLRLQDVLSAGHPLLDALRDDARNTIAPAAVARLGETVPTLRPTLEALLAVANRAIDSGSFDVLDAELLLEGVGRSLLGAAFDGMDWPTPANLLAQLTQALLTDSTLRAVVCKPDQTVDACVEELRTTLTSPAALDKWLTDTVAKLGAGARAYLEHMVNATLVHLAATLSSSIEADLGADVNLLAIVCPGTPVAADCVRALFATPPWRWSPAALTQLANRLVAALQANPTVHSAIATACQARLAVATIKACAANSCTATQIADRIERPDLFFAAETTFPAAACWENGAYVKAPAAVADVERAVIDGLELLEPVRTATGKDRAVAAIRLVVTIVDKLQGHSDPRIDDLADLAIALVRNDYSAALSALIALANEIVKVEHLTLPKNFEKLTKIAGAVAAYVAEYEATKNDATADARAARKKALESLIDTATDRKGRKGATVLSLGSNVGADVTAFNAYNHEDAAFAKSRVGVGVRVPLNVALQWLPGTGRIEHLGYHLALQLVDLGQFVQADSDVKWSSFVAPGLEAGFLFGYPDRLISLTVHAGYAPSLSTGASATGEWRYGISLGYYVPFLDLD